MITGHFAAGLALKKYDPSIPLWVLFVATQLVDIFFMVLLLLGIEDLRIVPGINPSNDLDLYYYPYTHGLLVTPLWIAAFVLLYALREKLNKRIVMLLGLAIASHWLFDLFTHTPDLPIIGDSYKVGFGLWNYPLLSIGLEVVFIVIGVWLYLKHYAQTNGTQINKVTKLTIGLGVLLVFPPALGPILPAPHSVQELAISGLGMYGFFTLAAVMLERVGKTPTIR